MRGEWQFLFCVPVVSVFFVLSCTVRDTSSSCTGIRDVLVSMMLSLFRIFMLSFTRYYSVRAGIMYHAYVSCSYIDDTFLFRYFPVRHRVCNRAR